ncbi:MAG: GPP34 family phosphoprotein [Bacteroidales bacterium]|nr:GPP34 family phosphoprotein [Bacteroidales bacterium]
MKLDVLNKFLLIAHHPQKNRFLTSETCLNYSIIGALLLDMGTNKQIRLEKNKLRLAESANSNNPIITEIIDTIRKSKKTRSIKNWMIKLNNKSNKFKTEILTQLEKKDLVRIEHKKILGLIPYTKSYITNNSVRDTLIEEIRNAALSKKELNQDTISILALIEACKLHSVIASNKQELKKLRKELKSIIKENPMAHVVDKTIKQIQDAIVATLITSATVIHPSN